MNHRGRLSFVVITQPSPINHRNRHSRLLRPLPPLHPFHRPPHHIHRRRIPRPLFKRQHHLNHQHRQRAGHPRPIQQVSLIRPDAQVEHPGMVWYTLKLCSSRVWRSRQVDGPFDALVHHRHRQPLARQRIDHAVSSLPGADH